MLLLLLLLLLLQLLLLLLLLLLLSLMLFLQDIRYRRGWIRLRFLRSERWTSHDLGG